MNYDGPGDRGMDDEQKGGGKMGGLTWPTTSHTPPALLPLTVLSRLLILLRVHFANGVCYGVPARRGNALCPRGVHPAAAVCQIAHLGI